MPRMGTRDRNRLHLEVTPGLKAEVEIAATEEGLSMSQLFRISFALFKVCREAKRKGQHVGVVNDVTKLDREIIGIL